MHSPTLTPREIPFNRRDSRYKFEPGPDKPFVATPVATETYQVLTIIRCLMHLQAKAKEHNGLD